MLFLDADDYLELDLFERLSSSSFEKYDIFFYGFNGVDENGKILECYSDRFSFIQEISGRDALIKKLNKIIWICHGNAIYKKSLVIDNKVRYLTDTQHGEDLHFICLTLSLAKKVGSMIFNGVNIRYRVNSVMHSVYNPKFNKAIYAAKNLYNSIISNPIYKDDNMIKEVLHREILEQMCYVAKKMIDSDNYSIKDLINMIEMLKKGESIDFSQVSSYCTNSKRIEYMIFLKSTVFYIFVTIIYRNVFQK